MSRELDAQLLESVAVRRNRLRESLLWGRDRRVRAVGDNLRRLAVGLVLAAVVSAGCVGWAFLQQVLADRAAQQSARSVGAPLFPEAVPGVVRLPGALR